MARPQPCPECKSVLCHARWCELGQAQRKALDAPPVNKMMAQAPRKK